MTGEIFLCPLITFRADNCRQEIRGKSQKVFCKNAKSRQETPKNPQKKRQTLPKSTENTRKELRFQSAINSGQKV
jgi:hypothetical protein